MSQVHIQRVKDGVVGTSRAHDATYDLGKRYKTDSRGDLYAVKSIKFTVARTIRVAIGDFVTITENGQKYHYTVSAVNLANAAAGKKVFYCDL